METIVQQQHTLADDSSDRSDSSTISQEYQIRGFESYEIVKRLNLAVGDRGVMRDDDISVKNKDFRVSIEGSMKQHHNIDDVNDNLKDFTVSIGKSREFGFERGQISDQVNYQMDRSNDAKITSETSQISRSKDITIKEAFNSRQKYVHSNFDVSTKKGNNNVERDMKDYGMIKNYNLPDERMKEFHLPLDRIRDCQMTVFPRDRLTNVGIHENSRMIDINDHRNLHAQSRNHQELENIAYERIRRSQHHLINQMDFATQNIAGTQLSSSRQNIATQIQQSQQQQQQQQIKSFTIDAILAHRNNQKERHRSHQQQLRKAARQECHDVSMKSSSSLTGNNVSNGGNISGKAKRVRTIFTAEQLERLEGEFARQQYMVGPERLYLAHALRLTEAQVKVWFQNRRIKWRKVNHEQQCLAVNEHRQRCTVPSLEIHEDESNDNSVKWCTNNSMVGSSIFNAADSAPSPCSQILDNRDIRSSPIIKS